MRPTATEPAEPSATATGAGGTASPTAVARELLVALRTGESPDPHLAALGAFGDGDLRPIREARPVALAFWCSLYNAGTQLLLRRRPQLYERRLRSLRFFKTPAVSVAGTGISLDSIEHGILRGGRSKFSLGYLPTLFVSSFEHRYRLADPDPRIHFALNCGAESCPPIRAYDPREIDDQLDLATRSYLDATVEYDPDADVVRVPRAFLWFRGDFGGSRGIRAFLAAHGAIPDGAEPSLRFLSWDWSRSAGAYAE